MAGMVWGRHGLELFRREQPELVITDIIMPADCGSPAIVATKKMSRLG
jgi:YesN/AraC family two-component response regulator